jgi:hypothetical protein
MENERHPHPPPKTGGASEGGIAALTQNNTSYF